MDDQARKDAFADAESLRWAFLDECVAHQREHRQADYCRAEGLNDAARYGARACYTLNWTLCDPFKEARLAARHAIRAIPALRGDAQ